MLVPVLISLCALRLTRADYSSYERTPVYQRPEGQLFQPNIDYTSPRDQDAGVSFPQSYQDLVTTYGPYQSPTQVPGDLESPVLEDRMYGGGYGYRPSAGHHGSGFGDWNHRPPNQIPPYHNNHGYYGPPQHHGFFPHHNEHDDKHRRPQHNHPTYNDFNGPPTNRQPFLPGGSRSSNPFEVIYSWKQVDFEFPHSNTREDMIRSQQFIPKNNLILDMDVYGRGSNRRVWVTLPRVRPGVPVTLATVSPQRRAGVTLLRPFPNWSWHFPASCQTMTSVFRTHVDQCGKLWVLDSGNNNAFVRGESRTVCPPKILIFDLNNNDRLIGSYVFPESMIANTSLLVTINVDSRNNDCSDAVAYMADSFGFKLLAFRLQTCQFWNMNSELFRPYPDQTMFSVNGVSFELSGGIFGLALGPVMRGNRQLFFHCIDSIKQSVVNTVDIQDPQRWLANVDAEPRVFRELNGSRSSQSAAAAMSDQGVMFFGLIGSNEMACWNTRTPFGNQNIVVLAKDDTNLQFNSGIKVYDGKLYVVTNRLQNYVTSQVREQEDNYRILVADLRTLTSGTKCDVTSQRNYPLPPHGYSITGIRRIEAFSSRLVT